MKRLIEFSFDEDIKNGRIASVLIPANKELFDFYGKMGYEKGFFIDEKIENRFTLSSTLSLAEIGQNADEIAEMVDIYANRLKDSYFIARDRDYFACQIRLFNELGSRVYLLKDRARTVGYCFLFDEAVPFAQELMTINDEKYLADFKALLFKQTQKDKIKFVTNDGDIPFGCIKWHKAMEKARKKGYMNLMFN